MKFIKYFKFCLDLKSFYIKILSIIPEKSPKIMIIVVLNSPLLISTIEIIKSNNQTYIQWYIW